MHLHSVSCNLLSCRLQTRSMGRQIFGSQWPPPTPIAMGGNSSKGIWKRRQALWGLKGHCFCFQAQQSKQRGCLKLKCLTPRAGQAANPQVQREYALLLLLWPVPWNRHIFPWFWCPDPADFMNGMWAELSWALAPVINTRTVKVDQSFHWTLAYHWTLPWKMDR